ncbi:MAG: SDR family NAD(P)-dependent oxidoreductase [Thermomicrobiales bacterium]
MAYGSSPHNKVALVTGASSGIGAATARLLAEEGADVVVLSGTPPGRRNRRLPCAQQGVGRGSTRSICATRPQLRRRWSRSACAKVGGLDALILNAGHNIVTPMMETSTEEWDEIIAINLNGPFYLLKAATPLIRDGGAIVTVSSVAGHTGAPHHAHYAAAKAGLINLTKSAARALGPRIRVNCVAPGVTLTAMGRDTADNLAPDYAQTKLLTGRFAEPEEVARCVIFLASPAVGFITGATLDVNGGRELR